MYLLLNTVTSGTYEMRGRRRGQTRDLLQVLQIKNSFKKKKSVNASLIGAVQRVWGGGGGDSGGQNRGRAELLKFLLSHAHSGYCGTQVGSTLVKHCKSNEEKLKGGCLWL